MSQFIRVTNTKTKAAVVFEFNDGLTTFSEARCAVDEYIKTITDPVDVKITKYSIDESGNRIPRISLALFYFNLIATD